MFYGVKYYVLRQTGQHLNELTVHVVIKQARPWRTKDLYSI